MCVCVFKIVLLSECWCWLKGPCWFRQSNNGVKLFTLSAARVSVSSAARGVWWTAASTARCARACWRASCATSCPGQESRRRPCWNTSRQCCSQWPCWICCRWREHLTHSCTDGCSFFLMESDLCTPFAQALIDLGCVTEKTMVKRPKPSLFSRCVRVVAPVEAKAQVVEPEQVYYEPTVSCCLRLSQVLPNEDNWNLCQPWGSSLVASCWYLNVILTGRVHLLWLRFSCTIMKPNYEVELLFEDNVVTS